MLFRSRKLGRVRLQQRVRVPARCGRLEVRVLDLVLRPVAELDRLVEKIVVFGVLHRTRTRQLTLLRKEESETYIVPVTRVRVEVHATERVESFEEVRVRGRCRRRTRLNSPVSRLHLLEESGSFESFRWEQGSLSLRPTSLA